ncbi:MULTISPECIES: RDD family protein [unclassified Actinomyces]|uniref:RDD family protein n=1 Tax=unclassified Actinomyces TaxID=2609248 RepID=UPI002016C4F7|nr:MULTISPECIES: RDD family protein [unclassified Actinomyces]MCL3778656.1 RDD family protein [Actinomyces sp. AC-20-1]MCL3790574.1 RDD family protein [Actinomyces sp. 187325]MCL3792871.1 RDD family protein [Actinomyces sp. 186855]MCL3795341.1 RDD family protein [Actinomyces sp. 217892]
MVSATASSSERMMTPDRLVTGEAVVVDIVPATVGVRLLGAVIDYGLYGAGLLLSVITWAAVGPGASSSTSTAALMTQLSVLLALWLVAVPLTVEVVSRGRSAGRLVTGCRVVRDDGGSIRLRHSLVRVLVGVVEVWGTGAMPALGACVVTRRGKRLGDLLAGTYVVNERAGSVDAPPLLMPPELAQWAQEADIRSLPGDLALASRTFLQRASSMQPVPRARLGSQLAGQVLPLVAPQPPAGTHPERLLAAVLCERRDRELALSLRDRQAEERSALALDRLPYGVGARRS